MRRIHEWLLLGLGFVASTAAGSASTSVLPRIRVLLLTGGHAFEREPFLRVFRDNPDIDVTHLEHAKGTADAWDRVDVTACDVVVLYDMPRTITAEQQARFLSLFSRGVGLVVTHHALCSYQQWAEYERIIGGRWIEVPAKGGDPRSKPSGYEHDVDIPVTIADLDHPVACGLENFTIRDEIYWDFRVGADVKPLLTTKHPKSGNPLAWCRREGNSRVVYLMFGHGPTAFDDRNYRRLLRNAIRWTGRRD